MSLPAPFTNALVLTGPTGSGKTQLGIDLALRLGAEIVSMDSMALYRGMDIGTAKPNSAQRAQVAHHLVDVLDPWESASVAWWLEQARKVCAEIEGRGKKVLFVGGTPLYLKALVSGLFDGPPADAALRQRLEAEARQVGSAALHCRLERIDPLAARRLHPNDLRRIVRALEVHELTGKPLSAWQTQWPTRAPLPRGDRDEPELRTTDHGPGIPSILCLDVPRAELYERINRRVDDMFASGLLDEVRRLAALEPPLSKEASQALGYKEVLRYLAGEANWEETVEAVKTRTRNFAKRQTTWFRGLPGCRMATSRLTWELWQLTIK